MFMTDGRPESNLSAPTLTGHSGRPARRAPAAGRRAFSLVELVMVLAIVGLVGAIAVPRYNRSLGRYRVSCAARRIAADLAYAQSQARVTSQSRQIDFQTAGRSYQIANVADLRGRSGTYTVDLSREPYCTQTMTLDLGGATKITFDAYGTPSATGGITVTSGETTGKVTLAAPPPTTSSGDGGDGSGGLITIRIGGLQVSL